MTISSDEVLARLSPERLARIEARFQELLEEEEMSLRDLRVVQHMTQADVAQSLGIEQESVSRMEHRNDVKVSTAANYVEALGGRLRLVAEFPGRRPYSVKIGDIADRPNSPRREGSKS